MKQTILITGCSSGIGYFCAKALHDLGHSVYATARADHDVARLQHEGLTSFKLDVTSEADIQAMIAKIEQENGVIDVLFNNAGYGQPGALEDLSVAALKAQFETNVFGNFALTKAALRLLRKSENPKIVQNSSILGFIALKYRGAYNASKYAIEGLSDTLRLELEPFGIKVCLIEPGPIHSAFRKNAYAKFKSHIRVDGSFYEADYKSAIKRFESTEDDSFTLSERAVYEVLLKIINATNPKPRYRVTFPTTLLWFLKRILSTKMLDKVLKRV
ncbi:SDR family NAD(P)-dependent oxidoreductase [Sulfurospirillum sp. 1612]|uniref:SDR family NAD(P)-dependent oxidoreductase n=1 Tax=Sulfurospirillum sp. 1612 TaxID=3094835 RepID=UPI002F954956